LQHTWNEIRRPTLNRVRLEGRVAGRRRAASVSYLGLAAAEELRVRRFAQDNAGLRPFSCQNATNTRDGATCPVAGDEIVQARPGEIVDDLASGCHFVDVCIGFGLELTGQEPPIGLG